MSQNIPIARPFLGEEEAQAAMKVIKSGWLTQGPAVLAFEEAFSDMVGAQYACAVSNCTSALHLALLVVGVRPGDEVITASHSFIATANAIRYVGAIPVFVDIEPDSYNLDPAQVKKAISSKTKSILAVHQMGMPCDLQALTQLAKAHGIPLVEDAACAIGSEIKWNGVWQKIGKPQGDIACFSFHPRKVLTTGDGGMITTNNREWDKELRQLRQHGMSVSDSVRHASKNVVFEEYLRFGYNYRMTDIQAAVGLVQLGRMKSIIKERRRLAEQYMTSLTILPDVALPAEPQWARSNWQSFCVLLPSDCEQQSVMQSMLNDGIATRRGIMCSHREPAYSDHGLWRCWASEHGCDDQSERCLHLKNSENAQDNAILLPLFPGMTFEDQERVIASLVKACNQESRSNNG
ncbi:MAG: DegT/DnrJ/EryC1/StrS family aminotransferase [Magnetococcales bacterium]|nr:DegT/DnrJ/EryC1/StrS family aminotransferase [Magnetococcales bacterium]